PYPGDATHPGSNSNNAPFTLTSPPTSTTTSVPCSPATLADYTPTSYTATVTDSSGTGAVTPTGSATFATNSTGTFTPTNSCALVAGVVGTASCSVSYTRTVVGHHGITGSFAGDSVHAGSTSVAFTVTSTIRSTTISVTCSPASVNINTATNCTATVTDSSGTGAVTPTGSVTFATNSTGTFSPSNSCALVAGVVGTASCSVSYTPTVSGHHGITGSFPGDSVHTGSTSSA